MATKIVTKNSSTASAVPTASDLVQGELAVNVADKKLFTEDNSGAIIELADGVKLAGIEASADVTDTANVTAAGALMDSELTSIASVKALNQGVATTDSPAFAGLTVDTTTLAVDSTNNRVGIGTSSPSAPLHVQKGSAGSSAFPSGDWAAKIFNQTDASTEHGLVVANRWQNDASTAFEVGGLLDDGNGFDTWMRVAGDGKVGIGTSSPSAPLHVNGASGELMRLSVTPNSGSQQTFGLGFATGANTHPAASINALEFDASDSRASLLFSTRGVNSDSAATERMRIDSSGNVGIGTTSPSYALSVKGLGSSTVPASFESSGSSSWLMLKDSGTTLGNVRVGSSSNALVQYAGGAERMRIDSSGNLLVGRSSTSGSATDHGHQLYASGIYYLYSSATGNNDAFRMYDGSGTLRATIDGDGDYTDLSDVRAKENIVNAPSVLSTINDLQVRSFTWKVDGRHQTYGFVAQELNEAIPEAVSLPEEEDGMWGVKHAKLVPVLIKAIQEQQNLIESLTSRIAALEE